jgi:hypothetical protein
MCLMPPSFAWILGYGKKQKSVLLAWKSRSEPPGVGENHVRVLPDMERITYSSMHFRLPPHV